MYICKYIYYNGRNSLGYTLPPLNVIRTHLGVYTYLEYAANSRLGGYACVIHVDSFGGFTPDLLFLQ
jgi:hypothetical protein